MKSYLSRQSKESLAAMGLAFVVVIEAIDSVSGPHLSFVVLYLLSIWFVTYFAGTGLGILISFVSAVPWLVVDLCTPVVHSQHILPYLNGTVRLEFYLIIVLLTSTLRRRHRYFEETATVHSATLESELGHSRQTIVGPGHVEKGCEELVGDHALSTY
jgi:hypothetical protein